MMKRVLVAIDGSAYALRAAAVAADLLDHGTPGTLTLIHIGKTPAGLNWFYGPGVGSLKDVAKQEQDALVQAGKEGQVILQEAYDVCSKTLQNRPIEITRLVVCGDAAQLIIEHAEVGGYEIIVLGSRGTGLFRGALLGSVSYKVLSSACCPVLIVK